jgi:hypothetical protein
MPHETKANSREIEQYSRNPTSHAEIRSILSPGPYSLLLFPVQSIVYYSLGTIFTAGVAIVLVIAYRQGRFSIPISKVDVLRRSAIRLVFCTLPYLALAWLWSLKGNDVLFHGFWFWYAVVLIPGLGLAFDLARPWAAAKPNDRGV